VDRLYRSGGTLPKRVTLAARQHPFHDNHGRNIMTTIGASLTITGEVTSHEDVTIHGTLNGKISMASGSLLVAPSANVQAEAQVSQLTIHGTFSGDVAATERVELTRTAQVNGTLLAPAVVLQDGAVFNGMIEVNGRTKARDGRAFDQPAKAS
jgi:cytoskeletal protein CcmA (bactofilin family)